MLLALKRAAGTLFKQAGPADQPPIFSKRLERILTERPAPARSPLERLSAPRGEAHEMRGGADGEPGRSRAEALRC